MPKTLEDLEKQLTIFDKWTGSPLDQLFGGVIRLFHDGIVGNHKAPGDEEVFVGSARAPGQRKSDDTPKT